MDPLSIATGIITLTTLIAEGLKRARTIHDAPAEIFALANEVADLDLVVQEVVKTLQEWSLSPRDNYDQGTIESVSTILGRAQTKLIVLDSILNRVLIEEPGTKKVKYARLAWLRQKSKVEILRKDLASIKLSLNSVIEAANSVSISRIHLKLDEITVFNRSLSQNHADDRARKIGNEQTIQVSHHVTEDTATYIARTDHGSIFGRERDKIAREPSTEVLYRSEANEHGTKTGFHLEHEPTLSAIAKANQSSIITIKASRSNCPRWCSCICHKSRRLNSPSLLNEVFGAMSIGYCGVPFFSSPCNEKRCRPRPSSSAQVTYQFPSWMMAKAVSMLISSNMAGPELQLRTLRIIPPNSDVFRLAITGDVDGMRSLIKSGLASIYDIDNRRWSILHKAFLVGQGEVCRFLLEQGADPSLEAANGSSATERAWYVDRTDMARSENDPTISNIFNAIDIEELAESQQYTTIHKIVLGLSKLDLETQLQHSTSMIDDVDTRGRTALWWAAARGDHVGVRTLLEYGASIQDPATLHSHSALHVAQTSEVVKLLLKHGAKVDCRDESERTPLHCCAYRGAPRGGSVELFESLLEGGADINAQSTAGHTPLHYTAMYGFIDHMPLLLVRGAPVDSRKPNGMTPLLDAVGCSQPRAVKFLLQNGADPEVKTKEHRNIIHIAASRSDVATMKALAAAELRGVDVDAKDCSSMTPRQCFNNRLDKSEALMDAFEVLLASVQRHLVDEVRSLNSDTEEDSDEFEDAVEIAG